MKTFTPLSFAILLSFITCGTYAAQDINDRDAWLKDATDLIEAGRIDSLEDKVKTTLGEDMHEDVTSLLAPLNEVMADHKAVYIDKIDHQELDRASTSMFMPSITVIANLYFILLHLRVLKMAGNSMLWITLTISALSISQLTSN